MLELLFSISLNELQKLKESHRDVKLDFGRGKTPTLILRKRNESILISRLDGFLGFTLSALPRALGEECGAYYREHLASLFPAAMKTDWPSIKLMPQTEEDSLHALLQLLGDVLPRSETKQG